MSVRSSLLPSTRSALRLSCRPGAPRAANQLRFNSTSTNQSKGNGPSPASGSAHTRGSTTSNLLLASIGSLALAGGLFLYSSTDSKKNLLNKSNPTSDSTVPEGHARPQADYQKVYDDIAAALETHNPDYDILGTYGPVLVRLAWHASGTYDKESNAGGSNGATMRFAPESNHGANAGLLEARDFMEAIHKKHPWISYSDLWTLGGVAAVQEMGGPKIHWRPGRKDGQEEHCTPDGRLPDGDKGSDHLRHIFYRMGFNDQEIVALSGAHALGRCHADRSGFEGPWTHSPNSFTNEYYNLLLNEKWSLKKWKGPIQFEDKSTKSLMMLTTDMALTTDKSFRKYVEKYAKSEDDFFKDFSDVYAKLLELGVPKDNWKPWETAGGKKYEFLTAADQEK